MRKPYTILNHTADIGIIVHGKDEKEIFANAGFALFDIMADLATVKEKEEVDIRADGPDREELFMNWLRELLDIFNARKLLLKRFAITDADERTVHAMGYGEPLDLSRHIIRREVKAATYHKLKVEKIHRKWTAQVIFDI